ncbi:MAG: methyltransferase dimerization domain-containing protein [Candidatus Latescibacterota bacterium]
MSFTMLFDPRPVVKTNAGYTVSDALFIAQEERIFTLLSRGAKTLDAVAEELGREKADVVERVLRMMVALGLLRCRKGLYSNTPLSEIFLREESLFYQDKPFEFCVMGCPLAGM